MMTCRLSLFCLPLFFVLFVSCNRVSEPEGFPDLVQPVTVKIVKDGSPLSGITVVLHSKDSALNYLVSADTGSDGVATIKTTRGSYSKSGVPKGKYTVQLSEPLSVDMPSVSMDASEAEQNAWQKEYDDKLDAIRTFPKVLNSIAKSPLEINVDSPPVNAEFDVSKYK